VRQDPSIPGDRGVAFWIVSDNLRKGASTNAVEIAEALLARDEVRARSRREHAVVGAGAGGAAS
jgi:aspartate-semialdehyde dehydrogenase